MGQSPPTGPEPTGDTTLLEGRPQAEWELARGSSVGRYIVLEPLGKGGGGAVYSALDPELERRVALKVLRTDLVGEGAAEWRARLTREAQAMARLSHPNVVTVFDVGASDDGGVFLAMERVDGGTLSKWLGARKRHWREIVQVLCAAGEGLAAAHAAGIIHRDFKLDNVLMGTDGRPRVTDFGLARAAGTVIPSHTSADWTDPEKPVSSGLSSLSSQLTLTGSVLGTPGYMAPEQYGTDEPIDVRVDVFSFCATAYRALYGQRPFAGDSVAMIATETINGRVREAPKGTDVPPWLRRVLLRGLSVEREGRPGSMREMIAALRADPAKRRRRWLAGAAIVASAGSIVLGLHAVGERRVRACHTAAADRLGGVWDAPRRAALESAFRSTRQGFADEARLKVEDLLDRYASSWTASAEDACLAVRVRGEQSEAMLELRTSCLDDRLDELRALGEVLGGADAKAVEKSVRAARSLSPIAPCSDVDRLGSTSRLPDDAAQRAEIRALRQELATSKAEVETGRFVEADRRMRAAQDRVEATHYGPLLVDWSMYAATVENNKKDMAEELRRTIALAETYRVDRVKASAEILLGSTEGEQLGHYEEGHDWLRLAGATIERLGGDAALEVERDVREGWIFEKESNHAAAEPLFKRALSRATGTAAVRPDEMIIVTNAHTGYATVLDAQGRIDEALEHQREAVRLDEETYGGEHPVVALDINNLAYFELTAGQTEDALRSASRALAILEGRVRRGEISPNNQRLATTTHTMGEILLRMHKPQEAIEKLMRARDVYRATAAEHDAEALADNEIGEASRLLGNADEAQRALDDARAIEAELKGIAPATVGGTLIVQAKILLDRKDSKPALEIAERGLGQLQAGDADSWSLADARVTVARALELVGGDSGRARALADEAREQFAKVHDDARAVDAAALLASLR
jgi:tetratricopeptide (TPR) repeat protein